VNGHQKKGIWRAITKKMWPLGVHSRQNAQCHKRLEDLRRWAQKITEAQLRLSSQCCLGARRAMTPIMARILAVAYLELAGHLRAAQQPQG
ncbi:hypothetical protein NDU88_006682, partial [Pleurodeles waltl]